MSNRGKFVVGMTAVGVGVRLAQRRRRRMQLRNAFDGIRDAIMPSSPMAEEPTQPKGDEAHAPGHQHLPPPMKKERKTYPLQPVARPFLKHYHGFRHPVWNFR